MASDRSVAKDTWKAPAATGPLHATVSVPGSKSATNRAFVLAGLADQPSQVHAALDARDTRLMVGALGALGVRFEPIGSAQSPDQSPPGRSPSGNANWLITPPAIRPFPAGTVSVPVGLAGTVMRFLPPMAALSEGTITIDGDPRARQRPLGPMLDALADIGVDLMSSNGSLPIRINAHGHVAGGPVSIDASASSQFISGLLLSAAAFEHGLELTHHGSRLPSMPHIDMTIAMLAEHGINVDQDLNRPAPRWIVQPGLIRAIDRVIEPDLSNAAPFLAAAMVCGGEVTVTHWPRHTTQAGDHLRDLFTQMGANVTLGDEGLRVVGSFSIVGIEADMSLVGELVPTIAALCALADGPSHLYGINHLRGHETDRLAALAQMLNSLGGDVSETSDGITINPRPLHGGDVDSYDDHRMATAAAIVGLAVPGVTISDIATTDKTLPNFPQRWASLVESTS
ncbi:MAG: 3-phosphoshikimate 1-carboxyvinyltransferase [Candidatus Nanopelagicales bacterium]